MATKYLEINSTYRNRNLWPLPGNFEVLISQTGQHSAATAEDPVAKSTPTVTFTSNLFIADTAGSTTLTGTVISAGVGATNSQTTIVFSTPPNDLHTTKNYYRHAVLRSSGNPLAFARITEYKYLRNDKGQVTVDQPIPLLVGDVITIVDPTDITDPSNALFFVPTGGTNQEQYFGRILFNESLGQFRTINGYDSATGLLTVGGAPVVGWLPTHNYSIRKEIPNVVTTAAAGSTTSSVILAGGGIAITDAYKGWFVRVLETTYSNISIPPQGEVRRIITYDGPTTTAIVSPPFLGAPTGLTIEILPFSYDNFNPFVYTGSHQHEMVAYQIKLLSLVIPNQILSVGSGGQIAFYPYVYVELTALEAPVSNVIYSNNPNATKMLFRASIDDIQNLQNSTFLSLDGDKMKQIIRFKVETNFRFRVILSNGEIFTTILNEIFSPSEPNPLVQISALFELMRL